MLEEMAIQAVRDALVESVYFMNEEAGYNLRDYKDFKVKATMNDKVFDSDKVKRFKDICIGIEDRPYIVWRRADSPIFTYLKLRFPTLKIKIMRIEVDSRKQKGTFQISLKRSFFNEVRSNPV